MTKFNFELPEGATTDVTEEGQAVKARIPGNLLTRQEKEAATEKDAPPVFKQLNQFINMAASPDVLVGGIVKPWNAVTNLGNAIGDIVQGKTVDVSDNYLAVSDETARKYNPIRAITGDREVTPADEAGISFGGEFMGEGIGLVTGVTALQQLGKLRHLPKATRMIQTVQKSKAARQALVAYKNSPAVVKGSIGIGSEGAKAIAASAPAAVFIDPREGNFMNFGDLFGLELPGRIDGSESYADAFMSSTFANTITGPLTVVGAGGFINVIKDNIAAGYGLKARPYSTQRFLDDLASTQLDPYLPPIPKNILPPGRSPVTPPDSAISRAIEETTQIQQVEQQRARLQDMGVVEQGPGGQLELAMPGVVNPETKLQIRQLQMQRGQLIKQSADEGVDLVSELGAIDQQIQELMLAGEAARVPENVRYSQPELDMPDGRPEADTVLAQLDELDDAALRQMHGDTTAADRAAQTAARMEELQAFVDGHDERMQNVQKPTEVGTKRAITKEKRALEAAQQELLDIQQRTAEPEVLAGDQLELAVSRQMVMDMADEPVLRPFSEVAQSQEIAGYKTPQDYRNALAQTPRDTLRAAAAPGTNPEVAAIVKLRTGRRVWQAKKSDIIDAFVELSQRRNQYMPPEMTQQELAFTANQFGADAPLFDVPADVSGGNRMVKMLDADGVEQVVPVSEYIARGMDPGTRERLKKEIIDQMIKNGEIQPPVTPVPKRPGVTFSQTELIDDLFAEQGGLQLRLQGKGLDDFAVYDFAGERGNMMLEELRLRLDYNQIDGQAAKAAKKARMDAVRWSELTWEEKKRLTNFGENFYEPILFDPVLKPEAARKPSDAPRTGSRPGVKGKRPKVVERWRPVGNALTQTQDGAKPPIEAAPHLTKAEQKQMPTAKPDPTSKRSIASTKEQEAVLKTQDRKLKSAMAAEEAKMAQALKDIEGGSCNG